MVQFILFLLKHLYPDNFCSISTNCLFFNKEDFIIVKINNEKQEIINITY